jgi:ligand-binding sensor domain-containing protein
VIPVAHGAEGHVRVDTQAGFARFTGVCFTSYALETPNPASPGCTLHIDRDGRHWIGAYKSLNAQDASGLRAAPPADAAHVPSRPSRRVPAHCSHRRGNALDRPPTGRRHLPSEGRVTVVERRNPG